MAEGVPKNDAFTIAVAEQDESGDLATPEPEETLKPPGTATPQGIKQIEEP